MNRILGSLMTTLALAGCETPVQGTNSPAPTATAPAPTAQICQTAPLTVAGGQQVQPLCKTYKQCSLFSPVIPSGARTSALPFFVMSNGMPTSQYPGPGNCL